MEEAKESDKASSWSLPPNEEGKKADSGLLENYAKQKIFTKDLSQV